MPTDSLNIKIIVRPTAIASIVRPRPVFKGGGWKMLALKQRGRAGKKSEKGGSIQKGIPLLKGGVGKVKVKLL